jgi:hypothetical protein
VGTNGPGLKFLKPRSNHLNLKQNHQQQQQPQRRTVGRIPGHSLNKLLKLKGKVRKRPPPDLGEERRKRILLMSKMRMRTRMML